MPDSVFPFLNEPAIPDKRKLDFAGYITVDADRTNAVRRSSKQNTRASDRKKASDFKLLKCGML